MSLSESKPLLTRKQVARYLGVSTEMVSAFVHAGELECSRLSPRKWKFSPEDVALFVQAKKIKDLEKKEATNKKDTLRVQTTRVSGRQSRAELRRDIKKWD